MSRNRSKLPLNKMNIPNLYEPLTDEEIIRLQMETKINPKLIPILFEYYNQEMHLLQLMGIDRKSFLISFECWLMTN